MGTVFQRDFRKCSTRTNAVYIISRPNYMQYLEMFLTFNNCFPLPYYC